MLVRMPGILRAAALQLNSSERIVDNLSVIEELVAAAAGRGARLVVLPENFAYIGPDAGRLAHAETLDDTEAPIQSRLRGLARRHCVHVLAGGWPERSPDPLRPYNSATLVDPTGRRVAHYRKIHLFDVTLSDETSYRESASVTPGELPVVGSCDGFRLGLSICYDLRFPELYRALVEREAQVLCVPSAFTAETGRDHFELLLRARAVESSCYVISANQWGRHDRGRVSYGRSMIVDPWGTVIAQASDRVDMVLADLDASFLEQVRRRLPSLEHRRLHGANSAR